MTKRAASGPFGTSCHHVLTKRAGVTKRAGCASNLTQFVTLVTKCAAVTKRTATTVNMQTDKQDSMTGQGLNGGMLGRETVTSKLRRFWTFQNLDCFSTSKNLDFGTQFIFGPAETLKKKKCLEISRLRIFSGFKDNG